MFSAKLSSEVWTSLFFFFPQHDQSSPWSAQSQIFHRQWPSHAFSIFFEPSLFRWAWQQKITALWQKEVFYSGAGNTEQEAHFCLLCSCLDSTWGFFRLKWAVAAHCWREENLHSLVHSNGIDSKWENLGFLFNCGCRKWNSSHVLAGHSFSSCRSFIPVTP